MRRLQSPTCFNFAYSESRMGGFRVDDGP